MWESNWMPSCMYCFELYCLLCIVLYCIVLYCVVVYHTKLLVYLTVMCYTAFFCTSLYCTVLHCTALYSRGHRKSDTLVNCQLSTVNCQLWPSHTPQQHPGIFPGGLHTLSGSQYLGKYYFLQFSKLHFFSRSGSASISWNFMTKVFCHEILNENVKKFLSNFPQTFLTTSWHFIVKIQNHNQSSPVTCHLAPRVIWTGHESLGRRLWNSGKFWLCSVCEKIHKTSSTRSILDFSTDIGWIETHLWQEIKTWTKY